MPAVSTSTGVTITNPLVLYRALLATKRIDPDPAQHRLAIHLQKLYDRLKDYEPIIQYNYRLQQISRELGSTPANPAPGVEQDVAASEGARRGGSGWLRGMFGQKADKDDMAMTRVLNSYQAALEIDSPKGLMLHGEVGTGKSMLIDLFADCLPNRKKKRRHFSTFMLEIYAKLEHLRKSRQLVIPTALGRQDDHSLLFIARDMISTSPVLFLDEFQLPDRAASKIMTNLMTNFFHLGGVLIATSNRMPEELAKAAGIEFTPPPTRLDALGWRLGRRGTQQSTERKSEFAAFLDVLKARCEVWQMEGGNDYRRRETRENPEATEESRAALLGESAGFEGLEDLTPGNVGLGWEQSQPTAVDENPAAPRTSNILPKYYFVDSNPLDRTASSESPVPELDEAIRMSFSPSLPSSEPIPWSAATIRVYGRDVPIPRAYAGVAYFTFPELCMATLGPADYITLASTYHTLVLTEVPILTLLQKNEARRFITLLDALYESRCKLLIGASAGPDDVFFPESKTQSTKHNEGDRETVNEDATYAETLSEIYQDTTSPFRPNISTYDDGGSAAAAPTEPDYTHARLRDRLADDMLEDGPPNRPTRSGVFGRGDSILGMASNESDSNTDAPGPTSSASAHAFESSIPKRATAPDFTQGSIYTGEDEKFAFKRAQSRLWELCGAKWWARTGPPAEWWMPVAADIRAWESSGTATSPISPSCISGDGPSRGASIATGPSRTLEESLQGPDAETGPNNIFRDGPIASPFRTAQGQPPKFGWQHAWGMMQWGKKAGAWGKGTDGLGDRAEELERRRRQGEGQQDLESETAEDEERRRTNKR